MMNNTDERVTEYIDSLPGWQRDVCNNVRRLVHEADPEVQETIKRGKYPFKAVIANNRAGGWRKLIGQ